MRTRRYCILKRQRHRPSRSGALFALALNYNMDHHKTDTTMLLLRKSMVFYNLDSDRQ